MGTFYGQRGPGAASYGASSGGSIPTSQTQGAWYFDFSNTTGLASDGNDGLTASTPLLTWGQVVTRWGTTAPRLRQNTTLNFLSSHPDTTDPIYFQPWIENGANVQMLGSLTQVQAGTFQALTAKTRSTGQLLNVTFASSTGLAAGLLVIDSTQSNSRAWTYTNSSGNAWNMSQPLPTPASNSTIVPNQNNSWTNGDSYVAYSLPQLTLRYVEPRLTELNASGNTPLLVKNIGVNAGASNDLSEFRGYGLTIAECQFNGLAAVDVSSSRLNCGIMNCDFAGFGFVGSAASSISSILVNGGQIRGAEFVINGTFWVEGDTIIDCFAEVVPATIGSLGSLYIETGKTLIVGGGGKTNMAGSANYGTTIYGPGTLDISGDVRFIYGSGAGTAVTTFAQTGGFKLNGQTTCWLTTPSSSPVANKTISAANLDSDLGASTGTYMVPGGASISNMSE